MFPAAADEPFGVLGIVFPAVDDTAKPLACRAAWAKGDVAWVAAETAAELAVELMFELIGEWANLRLMKGAGEWADLRLM